MLQPKKDLYTPEEYFAMEENAEYKSEYYHGEIFAMAGCTPNHNQITVNLVTVLNTALQNTPCRVFTSDMRIQVNRRKHYTYPDVSVVCGKLELAEDRIDIITNPIVIFEVLSESTKDYDRGSKFTAYRNISTLQDYILLDQEEVHIEYFHKDEADKWVLEEYKDIRGILKVYSLNLEISIQDIYTRVEW